MLAAFFVPEDREGFAPVTLTGEKPVAQLEVDFEGSLVVVAQPLDDGFFGVFGFHAVKEARVDSFAVAGESLPFYICVRLDDLKNGKVKLSGELEVAGVVSGDSHDGSGAVGHHDVVGDPDGDLFTVDGVCGVGSGEDAGLVFVEVATFEIGLAGAAFDVGFDSVF